MAAKVSKAKRDGRDLDVLLVEVVGHLRMTGAFAPALTEVLERKIVADEARKRGIRVTRRDLQRAADRFRASKDLHKARETHLWLEANGVTMEALEDYLRTTVLVRRFKDALAKGASRRLLGSKPVRSALRDVAYRTWLDVAVEERRRRVSRCPS